MFEKKEMPEFAGFVVCGFYDQFNLLLDTGESLLLNGFHNKLLKSHFWFWLHLPLPLLQQISKA